MHTCKRPLPALFTFASLVALTTLPPAVYAQRFVITDTTFDSTNTYPNGSIYVGVTDYSHDGNFSPTVKIVPGGSVGGMVAYNNSIVNVDGGTVGGGLVAYDESSILMSNGSVFDLIGYNNSTIRLSGGSVGEKLIAYDNSTIIMSGGSVERFLHLDNGSTATVSGGSIGQLNGVNISLNLHSTLNLIGTGLRLTDKGRNSYWSGEDYALLGSLSDGTSLSGYIVDIQGGPNYDPFVGKIEFNGAAPVPEPNNALFMMGAIGIIGMAYCRKIKRKS